MNVCATEIECLECSIVKRFLVVDGGGNMTTSCRKEPDGLYRPEICAGHSNCGCAQGLEKGNITWTGSWVDRFCRTQPEGSRRECAMQTC